MQASYDAAQARMHGDQIKVKRSNPPAHGYELLLSSSQ
jgi:hypothetical protein